MILLALIVLLSIIVFYGILQTEFSGLIKFFLVIIEMIIVSQVLIRKYKFPSEMGLILLKSKKGIEMIRRLAGKRHFWEFFSDTGSTVSYGLLSILLMRRNTAWKSVAAGMILLIFISTFVAPLSLNPSALCRCLSTSFPITYLP